MKRVLSTNDVRWAARSLANKLLVSGMPIERVAGVPRGGLHAAQLLAEALENVQVVSLQDAQPGDLIVDDLIDSGRTRERFPGRPFAALYSKKVLDDDSVFIGEYVVPADTWIVFPWEAQAGEMGPEENVVRLLQYIGEDPQRDGLVDTPARVVKALGELTTGYSMDPANLMTTFEQPHDEMVLLRDIEFYSMCEHHMLPFFGRAHVAYIPSDRVIGISKLARLVDVFARRLQIQERIGEQITQALMDHLNPLGAACMLEATHLCMVARGVGKQNSRMVTSSLRGVFRTDPAVRAEFLSMVQQ